MALSKDSIVEQSKSAYNQWAAQWREQAKTHSKYAMKPLTDFVNSGVGKSIVLCATGYSLEQNIEVLKKHQNEVDIMCCDKSLGILIDNDITPDFCVVCDANVSYEKYMEPWAHDVQNTTLFMNVCGNPDWTKKGNWADRYFFVNEDSIQSEIEFGKLSQCPNMIPAGTNVSNAMLIFVTQCSNKGRQNFFGYDKIILLGFDYCWHPDGNYYAFDYDGGGKRYYMKHVMAVDSSGTMVYTSNNLLFSAQWAEGYVKNFQLPIVNCSDHSMLGVAKHGKLEDHIGYKYKPEHRNHVMDLTKKLMSMRKEIKDIEGYLQNIGKEHWRQFKLSL